MIDIDENELLEKIIEGDRKAFAKFYKHNISGLYRFVFLMCKSKETSEEIIQNLFVKIWEKRESLHTIRSLKSYLFCSAKNLMLDHIRSTKIKDRVLTLVKPDTEESLEHADDLINYKQYNKIIHEAIGLLPEKRKQIIVMRILDDLSLDEIAEKLNISKNVVKKQLYKGLDFLREYVQQRGEVALLLLVNSTLLLL
jgi:RNA polymerase sigma-70 factor (ECF subfamily)